jgi:hypothetical protein
MESILTAGLGWLSMAGVLKKIIGQKNRSSFVCFFNRPLDGVAK